MEVNLGELPFVAIQNNGTATAPDIQVWMDPKTPPAQRRVLIEAMRVFANHIESFMDAKPDA